MTRPSPGAPAATKPSFEVPRGACDSHVHVMGPYAAFPMAEHRLYTSPEAPVSALETMLHTMGLDRVVVAHPSAFGTDLRVTLDAARQLTTNGRATIVLDPKTAREQIEAYHRMGVRGVRLAKSLGWEATPDVLKSLADSIVEFDWHIAIWPSDLAELHRLRALVETHNVGLVLDHMAGHCWHASDGLEQEGFALLLSMLQSKRVWLKISGMYRVSQQHYPWPELLPFGRKLAAQCSDRLLWASDWPHVGLFTNNIPQSHQLLDWLVDIGCDAATRRGILVTNPEQVFGFAPLT